MLVNNIMCLLLLTIISLLVGLSLSECAESRTYDFQRIIGGKYTTIDKFPHLVSIRYSNVHICGGTIISRKHVLTAAHCKLGTEIPAMYTIISGASYSIGEGLRKRVKSYVIHEKYNELDYDVGVIKIKGKFKFSPKVQSIALPLNNLKFQNGLKVQLAGWGDTQIKLIDVLLKTMKNRAIRNLDFLNPATRLREVSLPVVAYETCKEAFDKTVEYANISRNVICAGRGGVDSCQGDSGGGITYNNTVVGITSWGLGCGDPKYYGVYMSVFAFKDWIEEQMN